MSRSERFLRARKYLSRLWLPIPHCAALTFFAVLFLFYPYRTIFQADSDKGINLIKAQLVVDGYPLFDQVWSDQPPVFSLLLAQVFKLAPNDLIAGRTLVLLLASLLVWCLTYFVHKTWGTWYALSAVFLLLLLPYFPALSTAIMVGLPAIALAFLALAALATWHDSRRLFWLIVSGAALGLSVMTKLFTGILAPIFLLGIFLDSAIRAESAGADQPGERPVTIAGLFRTARNHWRKTAGPLLVWLGVFGLTLVGVTLAVIRLEHWTDLIQPHLEAGSSGFFDAYQQEYPILRLMEGTPFFLLLAAAGAVLAVKTRRWLALYPLAWCVSALTLLSVHSPVWYHHTLLVTLPACILAAGAVGELLAAPLRLIRQRKFATASLAGWALILVVTAGLLWQRLPPTLDEFNDYPYFIELRSAQPAREEKILEEIARYKPYASWMFTDVPMFAFQAGIPVPPELAVLTSKRLASGELTQEEIAGLLRRYKPEIILLGRYDFPQLESLLAEDYRLETSRLGYKLYIRKDLPDPG